jgi:hypothetical protein
MSPHPFSPWLDLVRATLPALQQWGSQAPAAQAHWARHIKSTLEFGKECSEVQRATSFALLQARLAALGTPAPSRAAQGLLDLQLDATTQLFTQWKALADQVATRCGACIDALRLAEQPDDVSFVVAGYLRDTNDALNKAAGETALLCKSANDAAEVLKLRMLDAMIDQPAPAQD